jgi:hypothetical protein
VTCFHVIESEPGLAEAFTSTGERWPIEYVAGSEPDNLDFAIYRVTGDPPAAPFLLPDAAPPEIGLDVIFAGFPHGIPDLMLQRAMVAGVESDVNFYLDGSVNEGNSGGPIVNARQAGWQAW